MSSSDTDKKKSDSGMSLMDEAKMVASSGPQAAQAFAAAYVLLQKMLGHGSSEKAGAAGAPPPVDPNPMISTPDFDARDQAAAAEQSDIAKLGPKYGAAPRHYRAMLTTPEADNEKRFVAAVPKVTAFVNQRLAAMGSKIRLTDSEVATNFLAEGGVLIIKGQSGNADQISGYGIAGIDTIYDRRDSLKPLLPDDVNAMMVPGSPHLETQQNERKQTVHSLKDLTLEQAMAGNAAMFAQSRQEAAVDLAKAGHPWASLTPREQFYWTTVYYNGGEGTARKHLAADGMEAADKPWDKADDFSKYSGNIHFNASWRTGTHELIAEGEGPGEALRAAAPRQIRRSDFVVEVNKLVQDEMVPLAAGTTNLDSTARARRELIAAVSDCGTDAFIVPQLNLWQAIVIPLTNIEQYTTFISEIKAPMTIFYGLAHRTMPDYGKLTLPALIVELQALVAALPAQLPANEAKYAPYVDNLKSMAQDLPNQSAALVAATHAALSKH